MSFREKFDKLPGEEIFPMKENSKTPEKIKPETKKEQFGKMIESKEKWEKLDKNLGISFQRGEKFEDFEEHLELIEKNNLHEAQFNLRKGINFEEIHPLVQKIKQSHPELSLSFHLDSPSLSKSGEMVNREDLEKQMRFSYECGANLVTLHPIDIEMKDYIKLSWEEKKKILENSAQFLAEIIFQAIEQNWPLTFAVENVGQTPSEMDFLLKLTQSKLGKILEKKGIGSSAEQETATQFTKERLGITLDINHALHPIKAESRKKALSQLARLIGKDEKEIMSTWDRKEEILEKLSKVDGGKIIDIKDKTRQEIKAKRKLALEKWFNKFEDKIKCLHVFTPTIKNERDKKDSQDKLTDIMNLYNKHNLDIPAYLETKKDSANTQTVFDLAKGIIKENIEKSKEKE